MQIIIANDVKSVITDIFDYSYNISPQYARTIVNKIYKSIYDLQKFPYVGRYVPELSNKHYRERVCGNYRIIYLVSEKNNMIFIRYIISAKLNSKLFFEVHKKDIINFFNRLFS